MIFSPNLVICLYMSLKILILPVRPLSRGQYRATLSNLGNVHVFLVPTSKPHRHCLLASPSTMHSLWNFKSNNVYFRYLKSGIPISTGISLSSENQCAIDWAVGERIPSSPAKYTNVKIQFI